MGFLHQSEYDAHLDQCWNANLDSLAVIGGVFSPIYLFLVPSYDPQPREVSQRERGRNFDVVGAVLSISSILCLVMAINFGGTLYNWNSGQIIALFIVAGVLLVAFAIQQWFAWLTTPSDRMFPVHLLKIQEANLLFVAAAGCNAAGFLPIYYIPVYFQFTRGDTALDAAVRLLPLIILLSATIIANGYLMSKLGYYQPWYLIGAVLALAGNVALCKCKIPRINCSTHPRSKRVSNPPRVQQRFMDMRFSSRLDLVLLSR